MSQTQQHTSSAFEPSEIELAALRNRLDPNDPEARVIWDFLLRAGYVGQATHQPGNDPRMADQNEGKRVLVLYVASLVGLSPFNMLKRR